MELKEKTFPIEDFKKVIFENKENCMVLIETKNNGSFYFLFFDDAEREEFKDKIFQLIAHQIEIEENVKSWSLVKKSN